MKEFSSRREFLRAATLTGAGLALSNPLLGASNKSVLVFTKSSGWEHDVVKRVGGKPSIVDDTINELGNEHGFSAGVTKDGRIFDSKEFHSYAGMVFFTTGDLTTLGTDGKPPMSAKGKQALLDAVRDGMGFVGVHAAADTFHTLPDPEDRSNRYIAHGDQEDPYLRMLGAEHAKVRILLISIATSRMEIRRILTFACSAPSSSFTAGSRGCRMRT